MLNQTNPSPGTTSSNSLVPQDPSQADPGVVKVMQAIKTVETGQEKDPYNAVGDLTKGVSKGAYQFNKDNYQTWAKQYGLNPGDFSPAAQNKVAYARIADLKNQGLQPEEIAAKWNGATTGTNGKLTYVNPDYGVKFRAALQGQGNQSQTNTPGISQAEAAGTTPQPQDNRNLLQKGLDFAFPVVSDIANDVSGKNNKSALQQVGDAALSALWFVPGLGEVGEGVARSIPLAAKVLGEGGIKTAGNVLAGAATGYGADVGSKLSSGETDAGKILTPGLGAVTGGITGGVASRLGGLISKNTTQEGALGALQKNIEQNINATKTGRVFNDISRAEGHNNAELIAKSGAIPDVVDGKFTTGPQQQYLGKRIAQLGEARAEALDSIGTQFNWKQLENDALENAKTYATGTGDLKNIQTQIKNQVKNLRKELGGDSSVATLEKIKEKQTANSKIFARAGNVKDGNAASYIGGAAKKQVEDLAEKSGFSGMKEYNKYIQSHYRAIDALKKMNGQAVKGGRLGNMLRGHAAGTAAAIAGSGMGPLGTVGGFLAGEAANKVLSKILGDTALSNPLRDSILKRIEQANPGIVEKLLQFSGQQGKKVAPLLSPNKSRQTGLLPGLLSQTIGRAAANGSNQPQ